VVNVGRASKECSDPIIKKIRIKNCQRPILLSVFSSISESDITRGTCKRCWYEVTKSVTEGADFHSDDSNHSEEFEV
jgi:hypothetical protein